jgi:flagellar hook-basal body protein
LGGEKQNMPSEPTTRINFTGNLNRSQLSVRTGPTIVYGTPPVTTTMEMRYHIAPKTIYDSLGHRYTIMMRFTYHPEVSEAAGSPHGYWTMEAMGEYYVYAAGEWTRADNPGVPGAVRLVHAFRDDDRHGRPALIGLCLLGSSRGGAGGGGDLMGPAGSDSFTGQMHSVVTIAFNSIGDLVGMGPVYEQIAGSEWYRPQAFLPPNVGTATDPLGWWRGRDFTASIVPISGVAPSATFGDTSGADPAYSTYQGDQVRIAVGNLNMNFTELGQRGQANTTANDLTWDGGGPGTLTDISIGQDGTILGRYCNGRDRILGQIPLAFFTNPAGLERVGNSFWRATANSGPFDGTGLVGSMIGGALEGSNVDLANEFTEMITTQRGFQAASRTITVSDEMLQELVNLRR